jgi:hypothetical protein
MALNMIQQKLETYKEFPQVLSLVSLLRPGVDSVLLEKVVRTVTESYQAYRSGGMGVHEPQGSRRWVRGREVAFGQVATKDPFSVFVGPLTQVTQALPGEAWSAEAAELSQLIAQNQVTAAQAASLDGEQVALPAFHFSR